jgi:adenine-specific DNA-methyltransferase
MSLGERAAQLRDSSHWPPAHVPHILKLGPDDVPEEIRRSIKHWSQYVDYWAIDWDYREDTFHNVWQTYRTKKNPKLETTAVHTYDEPGRYVILVKVMDILGNDTTKAVPVEVK